MIGVDRGVEFLYNHQIMPDYIVGDFDSTREEIRDYYKNETNVPVREYNPKKRGVRRIFFCISPGGGYLRL